MRNNEQVEGRGVSSWIGMNMDEPSEPRLSIGRKSYYRLTNCDLPHGTKGPALIPTAAMDCDREPPR